MGSYILGIDQGTTSSRAILMNRALEIVESAQAEFPQYFPKPGWVEHDAEEIWQSVAQVVKKVGGQKTISAIGITNQRETVVVWERSTGRPIHNAIVWQCRRTSGVCDQLKKAGHEKSVSEKTGLVIDPYFSATKIAWILDNVDEARAKAEAGELVCGTIDSFLTWRLTGGKHHVTDVSNASRTLLMNLKTGTWDEALCKLFRVPKKMLPKIVPTSGRVGATRGIEGLRDGVPIAALVGDQQAALFGQCCFEVGEAKCTYGTGSFLVMNTGSDSVHSQNGLLTTVAWRIGNHTTYALEGSSFNAGATVQWLRDGLKIISSSQEVEALAAQVPDSGGVTFVPAFSGLGTPYWDPEARAAISGISRGTAAAHIARAALEGIALQQYDILHAMESDSGIKLTQLKVDGGAAKNNLMMQFQADLLNVPLYRPKQLESTVIGAVMLAGLGVGLWKSQADLKQHFQSDCLFESRESESWRSGQLSRWRSAVTRAGSK